MPEPDISVSGYTAGKLSVLPLSWILSCKPVSGKPQSGGSQSNLADDLARE